jgi:hypothetical protein
MKKIDYRIVIGAALVVMGILMLLERMGVVRAALDLFWAAVFAIGALYFLYRFVRNPGEEWWAAIPGFALAGLAAEGGAARFVGDFHGLFFLGALGLGFLAVYLSARERWWAIIPGGVLVTLAIVAGFGDALGAQQTSGVLFIGIGITFLLVALLGRRSWGYLPAVVLLTMGALVGTTYAGALNYLWPAALILAGLLLLLRFARRT